jgi:hypothetical protein
MVENSTLFIDDEILAGGNQGVEYAMVSGAGSVASPAARRTIIAGLREVEQNIALSYFYGTLFGRISTRGAERDLLFSLRPHALTEDEAIELDRFRAKPSRALGARFKRVPNKD